MQSEQPISRTITLLDADPFGRPYNRKKFVINRELSNQELSNLFTKRAWCIKQKKSPDETLDILESYLHDLNIISCQIIDTCEILIR